MLNLILFGPPGAGKGTQSELLMQCYNLNYISTGEVLRNEIKAGSKLGLKAKAIIDAGGLVDDEIIVQIIGNALRAENRSDGFLFDGFPRTYVQAYILDGRVRRRSDSILGVCGVFQARHPEQARKECDGYGCRHIETER